MRYIKYITVVCGFILGIFIGNLLLQTATFVATAETAEATETTKVTAENTFCKDLSEAAYKIMYARQSGVPASTVLDILEASNESDDIKASLKELVLLAYKTPKMLSEGYKANACTEFSNQVFILCLEEK